MFIDTNNTGSSLISSNTNKVYTQETSKFKTSNKDEEESSQFQTALEEEQSKYLKEDNRTNKEIIEDMKNTFEDIKSVMKTGMTEEELRALEELLIKIKEEMKKEDYDKKDIEEMMQKLEKAIALYKKKITGEAIIEADAIEDKQNSKTPADSNSAMGDITARLDMAQKGINELKEGIKEDIPKQMQNQSELLEMIRKFQSE